ncbi:TIGR01212 family radical SAM protein [Candidatus Latescibacterota bacterium]
MSKLPYTDLNTALRARFGERVQKITVDAGFTCPNRDNTLSTGGCIYCGSRGSGTGMFPEKSITEQIESAKKFLGRRYKAKKFIAYFQSFSNTYAPIDTLRKLYEEALAIDNIVGLAIGTRPDCVAENVLELIDELAEKTYISMEYGLQSIHDTTLKLINRGHTYQDFKDAASRTRARGIEVCAHVILGLPGENKENMLATAKALGELEIQAVKIHLLYVIRGTALHEMYERGDFRFLTREEYTDIVCDFLALLPRDTVIHRLTGDPHPGELVAPLWALEKEANINAIRDNLRCKNIWQGKLSL